MKSFKFIFISFFIFFVVSCDSPSYTSFKIGGITPENYPNVDGSTYTDPLNRLIASKLLGYNYRWEQAWHMNGTWYLWTDLPQDFALNRIKASQTHQSIINLIDGKADLILSARKMSDDEKAYADNQAVVLTETPVALDAFVFVTSLNNPVKSLTRQQVKDIYTGKIKNWKEVGGVDALIKPYVRNQNSGSQELMEELVMQGTPIAAFDVDYETEIPSMSMVFSVTRSDVNALCYTVYYYKEQIVRDEIVKSLAIDGIEPNRKNIQSQKYPYVSKVYTIIRSDLDRNSMAYKLYELLQTPSAEKVISESGYLPF
jgi:phosphate transport system substrate-binding protein